MIGHWLSIQKTLGSVPDTEKKKKKRKKKKRKKKKGGGEANAFEQSHKLRFKPRISRI